MYTEKDIKVLNNSIEFIQKNPHMFLKDGEPNIFSYSSNVAETALILGSTRAQIEQHDEWMIILSDSDWTSNDERDVFSSILPFPEWGVNSFRPEVLITAFCSSVVFQINRNTSVIKGEKPPEKINTKLSDLTWEAGLAFKL